MKTDFYTKAVLTVIAVMLTLIAGKQFVNPSLAVQAAAPSQNLSFAVSPNGTFYLYDYQHSKVLTYMHNGVSDGSITLQ